VNGRILLPLVPFGIFLAVPKAQCQDLIGFRVRYQKSLIHEPRLFLQNRKNFVVDGAGEFSGLSRFGCGVIVCKDGFRATTTDAESFRKLSGVLKLVPNIVEVDGSSLFCEIAVP
jgi:hypothetical protein